MSLGRQRPTEDLGVVARPGGRNGTEVGRAATPERRCQLALSRWNPPGQFIPISRAGTSRSNSDSRGPLEVRRKMR
jgi:hypothetical protein